MGSHGGSRAGGSGGGTTVPKYTEADKTIQERTGGIVLRADFDLNSIPGEEKRAIFVDEYGIAHVERITGRQWTTNAAYVDGEFVNIDKSKLNSLEGNTYPIRAAAKAIGMEWNANEDAWLSKDHPLNRKIDYTKSELSKMSDAQLNKVAEAAVWQSSGNKYPGLEEKAMRYNRLKQGIEAAPREKRISAILGTVQGIAKR